MMESKKWQYLRTEAKDLEEMDEKLAHFGNLGWELAAVVNAVDAGIASEVNILTSPVWTLVLKQPKS